MGSAAEGPGDADLDVLAVSRQRGFSVWQRSDVELRPDRQRVEPHAKLLACNCLFSDLEIAARQNFPGVGKIAPGSLECAVKLSNRDLALSCREPP